jgi:lipopolysaccharide export system ATP-binding protein
MTVMDRLYAKGLVKEFNGKKVVNNVEIELLRGQVIGLLGPNGAGKTTTFYMIAGLLQPTRGHVYLNEEEITYVPMHVRARKGIYYLPQEPSVFRKLTVEENLMIILELLEIDKEERKKRLENLLNELNLKHLAKQKASSLSGGERRRLEITRALITQPKFMLLDEPFAGVDPIIVNEIKQIIRQLKNKGIGIMISDHNVRETLSICESAYVISHGEIIDFGPPDQIVRNKRVRDSYLGEDFSY